MKRTIAAVVAAVTVSMFGATTAQAQSSQPIVGEVASWTGMGAQRDISTNQIEAGLISMQFPDASPAGTNEECTSDEPPIVLIHGMSSNAYGSFSRLAPELKKQGRCLYAFNYGERNDAATGSSVLGAIPGFFAMDPMAESAQQVSDQIDLVREHTGSDVVDLIGYSEGGNMAASYAKYNPENVNKVLTISGVLHGTTLLGLSTLKDFAEKLGLPIDVIVNLVAGPAGNDLLQGSDYMRELNEGGLEADGVDYTSLTSNTDMTVTPNSASQFDRGNNIVIQDGCPANFVDHIGMPYDPRTIAYILNNFGGNVDVPCTGTLGPLTSS